MRALSSQQVDRAVGVLVGQAAGDALGTAYERGAPPTLRHGDDRRGTSPGRWSDDTAMAVCIAEVAATGADLRSDRAQEAVADGFLRWFADDPPSLGRQTRRVLREASRSGGSLVAMRRASQAPHERTGRSAGNGSLMRTGPVALAHLGDSAAIAEAARLTSALTHADPVAGDACVLWCLTIDHAVRTGQLDVRVGLGHVDATFWGPLIDEAESAEPSQFRASNGWVVAALQGAWSATHRSTSLVDGLKRAVAGGGDTDTVAAIAGQLLGAAYGGTAVPYDHRRHLHGWPGLRVRDLHRLAYLTAHGGRPGPDDWPACDRVGSYRRDRTRVVRHPDDPGVLLGGIGALRPGVADAVVSLCRLGTAEAPLSGVAPEDHIELWLHDVPGHNTDASGQLRDGAEAVRALRAEGKTVLLHCVAAHSRTPSVAAVYGATVAGGGHLAAFGRVERALGRLLPNPDFLDALAEMDAP